MDILPTFREIAGDKPNPEGVQLDGKSFAKSLLTQNEKNLQRTLLFFCNEYLVAARHGKYKIHFATAKPADKIDYQTLCSSGIPHREHIMVLFCDDYSFLDQTLIFNVEEDPSEDFPLSPHEYYDIIEEVKEEHEMLKKHFQKIEWDFLIWNTSQIVLYLVAILHIVCVTMLLNKNI